MTSKAIDILKAPHVGIKDLKEGLSGYLKEEGPLVVTDRGTPTKVILPYAEMIELLEILEEIADKETMSAVKKGRKAIKSGAKGVPVSHLFERIRKKP